MDFSFNEAIEGLGPNAGFRLINGVRPPSDYLLETLLPEMDKPDYYVDSANMTIRATMAGLVGTSSPYPPGGMVEASTFLEKTAKIGNNVTLEEEPIREIQKILQTEGLLGDRRKERLMTEATNFYEKVVLQGHLDTAEWLRAQCLFTGKIDWTFNKKHLDIDYGVPSSYFGMNRTGNDRYNAEHTDNKFWIDHYAALAKLKYSVRAIIGHINTVLPIINTNVLNIDVTQNGNVFTLKRWRTRGTGSAERPSGDSRDSLSIITYDLEGEVLDPTDTSKTIPVQFAPTGKLLYVGNNVRRGYRVGEGSTPDPMRDQALGYSHVAPTTEGGRPGRWGRILVPQDAQWSVRGEGAQNFLPVREDVTPTTAKTYVNSTALS
jgi:hypothetical protein